MDQTRVTFALCILISALLAFVLNILSFALPWLTYTIFTSTYSYFLTGYGTGTAAPTPYTSGSVYAPLGATALAFFVLGFVSSLVVFLFAGLEAAAAFNYPLKFIPAGLSSGAPRGALIGSWVAFSCTLIGLACGVTFLALINGVGINTYPGITFPGRSAASSAFSFSLITAILQTVHMRLCCCNRGGDLGRNVASTTYILPNAAFAQPVPASAAAYGGGALSQAQPTSQSSQWRKLTDGKETWFLNIATNESAWDLPPGARVVA